MDKIKLLLVDNDYAFAYNLKECLYLTEKYDIHLANNGKEGLDCYQSFNPDIIVTEIIMPIMNGKNMITRIKENNTKIPIIFTMSYHNPEDFIEGLKSGATLCMHKPFLAKEIDAQICTILKLVSKKMLPIADNRSCLLGRFIFNTFDRYLLWEGQQTSLSPTETKILQLLLHNKGQMVHRNTIFDTLDKNNDIFSSRSLDVFICKLRKYLIEDSSINIITIRNEGFILKITD